MGVLINKILKELHSKSIIKKVLNENYQDENISQEEKNSIIDEYGWLKNEEKIESILKNPPFSKKTRTYRIVNSYRVRYIISNEIKKNVYFNNAGWANFVKKVGQVIGLKIKATDDTVSKFFKNIDETKKYGLVKVINGKEKGKTGEVLKTFPLQNRLVIKGINFRTKHVKPNQEGENGRIVTEEASIHASNVMFFSKEKNITSKIEYFIDKEGVKKRRLKKTGELID